MHDSIAMLLVATGREATMMYLMIYPATLTALMFAVLSMAQLG